MSEHRCRVLGLIAAVCVVAAALTACSRNGAPNSLFDQAGYYVRGDKVYYLSSFPAEPFEIEGADAASFHAFDTAFARDKSNVYYMGHPIPGADAASFELLNRPGFGKDKNHVYQREQPFSDDPAHFELLDADLSKDSAAVYWMDGRVLSNDPAHFVIISNNERITGNP